MRVAVVGHVEWVEFARVERIPTAGEIVHASDVWAAAGGGGAVAAVQLARLAGEATLYTVLGNDELGRRVRKELTDLGVRVEAAVVKEPQRRAFTLVDGDGERAIVVLGQKLRPTGEEGELPWEELRRTDGVYFVSGRPQALQAARRARVLVATSRELATLREAAVGLDALVGSGEDESERFGPGDLDPPPRLSVTTSGALGGWMNPGGPFRAAPIPGPIEDAYGCGDSFAAGLTFGLAEGRAPAEAVELAAQCGAAVLTGRAPYDGQLTLAQPKRSR